MGKYKIIGIKEPGHINVRVDGRFRDIELHTASDEILGKLYAEKCPYVELTPDEFLKQNPDAQKIDIRPIKPVKKRSTEA
jgi:hypothetical protein